MTVQMNMKKDVNSMSIAPVSIICACLNMIGIARLPTVDAPVKNLAASIHPPPSRLIRNWVEPPPKNIQGIGTTTYMSAESIGHQLLYIAHARICRRILDENMKASPASTSIVIAMSATGNFLMTGDRLLTDRRRLLRKVEDSYVTPRERERGLGDWEQN
uniref:Uncharacterized protein n=2 Tax=Noccaea caerulescens TaxID=107243 RepID=A0A1J3JLE6_NOCCA